MRNRFTTRNQWFTETIETIRTSGLTLIISTIRFFKTFIAEFGFKMSPVFSERNSKGRSHIFLFYFTLFMVVSIVISTSLAI
ncbi:MAG: hypothetical protein KBF75_09690 [Saprospiraceae bacterium]|nr:hypothetical protein [Saprospiraceae bacterium]